MYLDGGLVQDRAMTQSRVILLTGEAEAGPLADTLRDAAPGLDVVAVFSRAQLEQMAAPERPGTRLISFCSAVIVSASVLNRLPGPAYNFHPGPPERPGRYPSVFALYDDAKIFGITVHEMVAKVDAGPIVAAEWFEIPPAADLGQLDEITYIALYRKFRDLTPLLVNTARPLPRMPYRWSGRKTTKAECDALCRFEPGLAPDEIARRKRACGSFLGEG